MHWRLQQSILLHPGLQWSLQSMAWTHGMPSTPFHVENGMPAQIIKKNEPHEPSSAKTTQHELLKAHLLSNPSIEDCG